MRNERAYNPECTCSRSVAASAARPAISRPNAVAGWRRSTSRVLHYALFRQGMLAMTGAPIRAFACSREGLEAPDLMLGWIPMLTEPSPRGPRISRQSGLTPDGFVREVEPPLGQEFLDVSVAQGGAQIKPDRMLDDRRRKAVPAIGDFSHRPSLPSASLPS